MGAVRELPPSFSPKSTGFKVIAADLWSDPTDNQRFFDSLGLTPNELLPIKADANALPFAEETFDAVISTDSYHYFGSDPNYLGERLLPYIKHGGYLYIAVPGLKKDCHNDIPPELLVCWTAEDLDTIHDIAYWTKIISQTDGIDILSIHEMESNEEVWDDWLKCDNEYAVQDRKAKESGGLKHLNFIAIILKRK